MISFQPSIITDSGSNVYTELFLSKKDSVFTFVDLFPDKPKAQMIARVYSSANLFHFMI